jgi:hypothetical protein
MPQTDEGVAGVYDLSVGRYDVKADLRKNPLTQRQENVELLTELVPALPPEMQAAALPIMFEEMEGSVMRKLSAALKPNEGTVSIQEAQQAQQMIDGQAKVIEELQRKIDSQSDQSLSKEKIALSEIDSKERIEAAKLDLEREKMLHEAKMKELDLAMAAHQAEFDAHEAELASGRELVSGEMDRQHQREMTETGLAHQTFERQDSQGFDAEQSEAGHERALELQASKPEAGA